MRYLMAVVLLGALALPALGQVAGGVLLSGGEVRAALEWSLPLYQSEKLRVDLDVLHVEETLAGGLSAPVVDLARLAGLRLAPQAEAWLRPVSVGAVVLRSGRALDAGLYWKLTVAELRF